MLQRKISRVVKGYSTGLRRVACLHRMARKGLVEVYCWVTLEFLVSPPLFSDLTSRAGDGPRWLHQPCKGPEFTLERNEQTSQEDTRGERVS